ncbi:purine catabolism regulator-like protein [Mycolicibacterium chubuense NBB4]|uniref:Purine catabolism regulator-like protein n=1 Tax=Mycolicibacterium chubuense (strain NBB4) TaxID=710421 RepID=I4BGS1_MYCCN|nr:PucR family transcriptional regulator [Mycolicibacterium chubuense]AFM16478.1 purine catabolism regulator-like protein [Mycolicibacterium chubuense NBB4]
MDVTVGEVIDLPVVQRGSPEVLSACRWGDPIRWLHVGEVADLSSLLQGGELVLTTGVGLGRAPRRYLQGLADAGALGVVVELGTALTELPDAVTDLARQLDLALVALHRQVRFVDVTEAVHRRIVAEQYEEVAFDRRVHEAFTELSMKRASVAGIVDAAARILELPVVLEDLAHQAIAVSASGAETATLLDDWELRSRRAPTGAGGAEHWVLTPVGPRGEEWGRLIVPTAADNRARVLMVLERASAAPALNRMIERSRSGLHQQAQSGLIDDVVQGRISDEREAAARAHALGLRKATRYFPVVVRVERSGAATDPVAVQRRNVVLLDAVAHTVNAAGHTGLFSSRRDGEIAALLAVTAGRTGADKALADIGERLRHDLRRVAGVTRSVCAVAAAEAEITEAIRGLAEAGHVAEVALAMPDSPRRYFRASDVRLRGLMTLLRDDPRVQRFAETELKPLLDRGVPADVEILREYLSLAGNKAALAQRLHISRPALYKRLATIAETLGVDLDDAESMTSLAVALMVFDARRRIEPASLPDN